MVSPKRRRDQRAMVPLARAVVASSLLTVAALAGSSSAAVSAGAATRGQRASSTTVWLCRPGQANDPCATSRTATSVSGTGATSTILAPTTRSASRFDCFYVYPTVSTESGTNADLTVQPAETAAAFAQASRFSQVCNVWAPMYRQATSAALAKGEATNPAVVSTAYNSLLEAWKDYLAHDNHGRPIVFLGHSQGAAMLIKLLQAQVDPSARLRKRMVSAIILGGNVQVPTGRTVGGSFKHIPTCSSASQTGCVIAYSSFGSIPPTDSFFGRPGQGVSLQSGQTATGGQQVACVNPATFSSRAGTLQPYFPAATSKPKGVRVLTSWVTFPGLYRAQCQQSGGASWLQVTATPSAGDPRPTVSAVLGPTWGYHLDDVNLGLGNLVVAVSHEEAAYRG
jgi:Protein of unknown function (DUF3089)